MSWKDDRDTYLLRQWRIDEATPYDRYRTFERKTLFSFDEKYFNDFC